MWAWLSTTTTIDELGDAVVDSEEVDALDETDEPSDEEVELLQIFEL